MAQSATTTSLHGANPRPAQRSSTQYPTTLVRTRRSSKSPERNSSADNASAVDTYDEHHPCAVTLVTAQPLYPYIFERHRSARLQWTFDSPRTQIRQYRCASALIPFVVIIRSKRTQRRIGTCSACDQANCGTAMALTVWVLHFCMCLKTVTHLLCHSTVSPSRSIQICRDTTGDMDTTEAE